MKLFISWSGDLSRQVGQLLHEQLPKVIQALDEEIFLSQDSIASGARWNDELQNALETSNFGILCLTADNLSSPWLNFEAGALTKHRNGRACALYLGGLTVITGPLSQFQGAVFGEAGLRKMLGDINRALEQPLRSERLAASFDAAWPALKREYDTIIASIPPSVPNALTEARESFICRIAKLPLKREVEAKLGDEVERIRTCCLAEVRKLEPNCQIEDSQVRANVFLPAYSRPGQPGAFELYMPPALRRKMDFAPEWDIRFAPGEGGTGAVFTERMQRIIEGPRFLLSDERRAMIHPELEWFISTPITDNAGCPLGVLNIDGLKLKLKRTQLDQIAARIKTELHQLASLLDKQPKAEVEIRWREER